MSANLDKSLDEIISAKPRAPRGNGRSRKPAGPRGSGGVGKSDNASSVKKAVAKKSAPAAASNNAAASRINVIDEASKLADRIIISNLVCTKLIQT